MRSHGNSPADGAFPIVFVVVIVGREENLQGGSRAIGLGSDVLIVDPSQRRLACLGSVVCVARTVASPRTEKQGSNLAVNAAGR